VKTAISEGEESILAAAPSIDGTVEGVGSIRVAGQFKSDVHVQGNLAVDACAKLAGLMHSQNVISGGELHGNIEGSQRVELLSTGVMVGDVKAPSLVVAAGSRMRGRIEFGWDEKSGSAPVANKPG
jgi:cytoskeletal protein CcmA (bactofilin family)